MSKKDDIKGLLNKTGSRLNSNSGKEEIINTLTGLQENVNTVIHERKSRETVKATFELDVNIHTRLKIFAASRRGTKMVDVVEAALLMYLNENE